MGEAVFFLDLLSYIRFLPDFPNFRLRRTKHPQKSYILPKNRMYYTFARLSYIRIVCVLYIKKNTAGYCVKSGRVTPSKQLDRAIRMQS